ncbi:CDP-diacylglycerol--glycerol-3-phosphate 3-phosphatidyltransferase 2 isoform X3 [Elaeis guineensis]|uniref:Cardiolipin synthase (CMP-forming), mitochondrial isoform X2 n=1 Tax=Elaeis guineensis var. tenera TaxID=51953 RepID=A0A8N4I8P2_ELAGV|nr:cardiolipin synthase (CMP-forming), mitochondrial isoform X2 [Elaeis guineensis]
MPSSPAFAAPRTARNPGALANPSIAEGGEFTVAARFVGEGGWWRMGLGSGRGPFAGAGARKRGGRTGDGKVVGGGVGAIQRHGVGTLHQYLGEEGAAEMDGGYNHQQSPPKLLTLPTVLTLGRVVAVPVLVSTYHMNGWWATTATTIIFLAAAFTDWLDGYIARKMRLGTAFGAFLDPVADKLMVAATLVLLCTKPVDIALFVDVPWLLTVPSIAIIGREITMSAVREWAASQGSRALESVAVSNLGKWKTAAQMTALSILLATRDPRCLSCSVYLALIARTLFLKKVSHQKYT